MDLECQICCDSFTTTGSHRPRCLPCGHTICTACIKRMLVNKEILCPVCQESCLFTSLDRVTINHELEKIITEIKSNGGAQAIPKVPKLHDGICDEHGTYKVHHCLTHKASICSDCVVAYHWESNCQRIPLEKVLNERKTDICKKVESHISVLKATGTQIELCKKVISNFEQQTQSRINRTEKIIQQHQNNLRTLKENLNDYQKICSKYTTLLNEFQNQLDNSEDTISKVKNRATFQELTIDAHRIEVTNKNDWTRKVKCNLSQTYVAYTHGGQKRCGNLMIKDEFPHLLLQKFEKCMILDDSIVLDLVEINKMLSIPRKVYMTLSNNITNLGLIVIELNEEAPKRAQQLLGVFLGHNGKKYYGHNEITVGNKGCVNQYLDFPFHLAQGENQDIPILEKNGNIKHKPGLVVYDGIDSPKFRILTQRGNESSTVAGPAIGEVILGMPLLKQIISRNLVKNTIDSSDNSNSNVFISETGLVLE